MERQLIIDGETLSVSLSVCERLMTSELVQEDVLALAQAHVDAEYEAVLEQENGDHEAAAIAFMLRGIYSGAFGSIAYLDTEED